MHPQPCCAPREPGCRPCCCACCLLLPLPHAHASDGRTLWGQSAALGEHCWGEVAGGGWNLQKKERQGDTFRYIFNTIAT